jgi:hypothetical protein
MHLEVRHDVRASRKWYLVFRMGIRRQPARHTDLKAMDRHVARGPNLMWRSLVILATTPLTIFWILAAAFDTWPSLETATASDIAAATCFGLASLSLATTGLAAGLFGDRPSVWAPFAAISIGWLLLALPLAGADSAVLWITYWVGAVLMLIAPCLLPRSSEGDVFDRWNVGSRSLVILVTTLFTIFWILAAPSVHPWVVPADSDLAWATQREVAAMACLFLAALSLATTCMTAGFFGQHPSIWPPFVGICVGWLLLAPLLAGAHSGVLWIAYGIGAALILIGAWLVPKA